ncbi:MAG: flagellar biosynthesis regulator FlaF [Rhodospirillales bacterium]
MTVAYQAYGAQQQNALGGRTGEAHAFAEAARRLHEAKDEGRRAVIQALKHNLSLWTQVQAEVSAPDHPMSPALRDNILALSIFVDRRTVEAIADADPGLLDALIDINRGMAQGQMTPTATTPDSA